MMYPTARRVLISLAIVLAVLLALALYGFLTGGWDSELSPP